MIAYKLCRKLKNGSITFLFINKSKVLEFNKWLVAESYPTFMVSVAAKLKNHQVRRTCPPLRLPCVSVSCLFTELKNLII